VWIVVYPGKACKYLNITRNLPTHTFYRPILVSYHWQPPTLGWGPTKHPQLTCLLTCNVLNQYMYVMIKHYITSPSWISNSTYHQFIIHIILTICELSHSSSTPKETFHTTSAHDQSPNLNIWMWMAWEITRNHLNPFYLKFTYTSKHLRLKFNWKAWKKIWQALTLKHDQFCT